MQNSVRKVLIGTTIFVVTCVIAVFGYWMAGWSLIEAIYMVIITIYGVGYGEVRPVEDPTLRLFTVLVIVAGCTSAIYVLGGFIQMITEGQIKRALEERRMTAGIEKLNQHAIICGFGRVGQILADELLTAGKPFVVVDTNRERLISGENQGMFVINGDATTEEVLTLAGVERASVLATVLPNDAANVFITLTARELRPDLEIIARGESPSTQKKLLRSGADRVVLPAAIGAVKIARLITCPTAESLLSGEKAESDFNDELGQIGLRIWEVSIDQGSPLAGYTISQLRAGEASTYMIVAVREPDGTVHTQPPADHQINQGDVILVLYRTDRCPQFTIRDDANKQLIYRGARTSS
ncbi:MAG: NAD-binding protein [Planctomycetaceae bacterium]|nr:NAD-binding protein [Planctomycetaceae bacterium]